MVENQGALSWDSPIEKESSFILLPEGEYEFRVEKMERGQYQPSETSKIREACPEANLELKIQSSEGEATVFERLILHSQTEWKISEFFISIGQKKKGQPLVPNWSQVPGATGRAKIEVNRYKDRSGNQKENNRVVEFLEPEENSGTPTANPGFNF